MSEEAASGETGHAGRGRWILVLLAVFLVALLVRTVAAARVALIERDGIQYLEASRRFAAGDARGGLAHYYPPAYPLLVAGLARAAGRAPDEATAQAASAVSGSALAVLVALAAAWLAGRRAGALAGLVAALHPASVEQAAKATADPLFSALVSGAVLLAFAVTRGSRARTGAVPRENRPGAAASPRGSRPGTAAVTRGRRHHVGAFAAGLLSGAAYLARPEGLVFGGALAATLALGPSVFPRGAGRRAGEALLFLLGALALVVPYVRAIRPEPSLTGGEAGAWKLTKKRELFLEAGGERAFPRGADGARAVSARGLGGVVASAAVRGARILGHALQETNPLVAVLAALGVAATLGSSSRRRDARSLLALTAFPALGLLGAWSLVRSDVRYGTILAALTLPFAGVGLAWASVRLDARSRGAGRWLVALALLGSLPFCVRARLERRATWRLAAEVCRGLGVRSVAAMDPRVAFYSGAAPVDLFAPLRDAGQVTAGQVATGESAIGRARTGGGTVTAASARAAAVVATVRGEGAGAIVLGPHELDLAGEIAWRLGSSPPVTIPVVRAGAEPLLVLVVPRASLPRGP